MSIPDPFAELSPPKDLKDSLLMQMSKEAVRDTDKWFPHVNNLPFMVLAMCGEAGEVANLVKKAERGSADYDDIEEALQEEVVDVFTYLLNIAGLLGLDLEEGYRQKREFNSERFA